MSILLLLSYTTLQISTPKITLFKIQPLYEINEAALSSRNEMILKRGHPLSQESSNVDSKLVMSKTLLKKVPCLLKELPFRVEYLSFPLFS